MTFGRKIPHAHIHLIPHNDEKDDYKKARKGLGDMQENLSRRPTSEEGKRIAQKFKL